jgi:hypothetical protein
MVLTKGSGIGASSGRVEIGYRGIVGSTIAMIRTKENAIGNYFLYYSLKEKETEARGVLDPESWTQKWGFKLHNTVLLG